MTDTSTHIVAGVFAAALLGALSADAQPSGGQIVSGRATISAPNATTTIVNQTTSTALINWQSFSLSAGTSIQFNQPGASALTLNRVLGGGASLIDGTIGANGQVWIINSNGILFGQGSQINVAGLLATTSDIADSDFAAGRYNFSLPSSNASASVSNAGSIHIADGGSVMLSGAHVGNTGLIQADAGRIVLGGSSAFTVDFDGDNLLRYVITAPITSGPTDASGRPRTDIVSNSGTLSATGGRILLTSRAAASVLNNVINNTGAISATSASVRNGEVVLDAGEGTVNAGGTLDASGNGAGETGGSVTLAGSTVRLSDQAGIDVSGDLGGGSVSIGGGVHGSGPYAPATSTSVGAASITADAHTSGNGGTVSIWSTGNTDFSGTVSAQGGARSGDGGLVEASGHILTVGPSALVVTAAANGASGEWLLDPTNLTIVSNPSLPSPLVGGVLSFSNNSVSTISTQVIAAALAGGTNVTLQAANDITVGAVINSSAAGRTLELDAGRSIIVNANIALLGSGETLILSAHKLIPGGSDSLPATISGPGIVSAAFVNLVLGAGGTGIGTAAAPIQIGGGKVSVTSNGANTFLQAASGGLLLGNASLGAGTLVATSASDLSIAAGATIASSATGNAVVLSAAQNFINNSGSGAIALSGPGRFLIYSAAPGGDTFGGLNSANTAIWNATYATLPPASVTQTGNRYLFAYAPTVTVTTQDVVKTYGADATAAVAAAYALSGLQPGVANAFLGDTVAGTPSVTSAGSATTANVSPGSPYAISATIGSLAVPNGYALIFQNTGRLTVNPATLSITANNDSKIYGALKSFVGTAFSAVGLVTANGDSITSVAESSTGAPVSATVGTYAIVASAAVGTGLSNYTISYLPGTLTVNPAALAITANDDNKTYGTLKTFGATAFSQTGLVNGDAITGVSETSSGAPVSATVGTYAIVASAAVGTGLNNYTINYLPGSLTVNPAALSITANNDSKSYGTLKTFDATAFSQTGLVNGDTITAVSEASSGAPVSATVGTYSIVANAAVGTGLSNYTISYLPGTLTVNPAALAITANDDNKTYGTLKSFGATAFSQSGLVNGDTITGVSESSSGAPVSATVGMYSIVASGAVGTGLSNYTISYLPGTLTVNPATSPPDLVSVVASQGGPQGDRPADLGSSLYAFSHSDSAFVLTVVITQNGGTVLTVSVGDGATDLKPIASLTMEGSDYVEPPTSLDRLSDALSRYFNEGSLFEGDYPSWGNDALWNCAQQKTIRPLTVQVWRCMREP